MTDMNNLSRYDMKLTRANIPAGGPLYIKPSKPFYVDFARPIQERRYMTYTAT